MRKIDKAELLAMVGPCRVKIKGVSPNFAGIRVHLAPKTGEWGHRVLVELDPSRWWRGHWLHVGRRYAVSEIVDLITWAWLDIGEDGLFYAGE